MPSRGRPRKDGSPAQAKIKQPIAATQQDNDAAARAGSRKRKKIQKFEEEVWIKSTSGKKKASAKEVKKQKKAAKLALKLANKIAAKAAKVALKAKKLAKKLAKKKKKESKLTKSGKKRKRDSGITAVQDNDDETMVKICAACAYGRHTAHIEGCDRRKKDTRSPGRSYKAMTPKYGKKSSPAVLVKAKKNKPNKLPIGKIMKIEKKRIMEICKACAFGRHTAHIPGCGRRRSPDSGRGSSPRKMKKMKKSKKKKKSSGYIPVAQRAVIAAAEAAVLAAGGLNGMPMIGLTDTDGNPLIHQEGECTYCIPGSGKNEGHIGRHMLKIDGTTYSPISIRQHRLDNESKPGDATSLLNMLAASNGAQFLGSPRIGRRGMSSSASSKKVGVGFVNSSDRNERRRQGAELWNDVVEPYFVSVENDDVMGTKSHPLTYREIRRMVKAELVASESVGEFMRANAELERMATAGDTNASVVLNELQMDRPHRKTKSKSSVGISKAKWRACITYMESTVVDIYMTPLFYKPVSLSLPHISSI